MSVLYLALCLTALAGTFWLAPNQPDEAFVHPEGNPLIERQDERIPVTVSTVR